MKTKKLVLAALIGLAAVACSPKGAAAKDGAADQDSTATAENVNPKTLLPSKADKQKVSYLVGVNFGSFIKGYGFGDLDYGQIEKGIKDFIKAKGDFRDSTFAKQFKVNPEEMNDAFNEYLQKMQEYTGAVNKQNGEKFLAENAKKEGVQTTASGLQYKIIEAGNDVKPAGADTVWVNYKGELLDGTVFDQSQEGEPVKLTLNRVIRGWQEGMGLIGEGGKIELYIPSDLGYGAQGTRGIEPNSVLKFEVELTKVGKFVEPVETEEAK